MSVDQDQKKIFIQADDLPKDTIVVDEAYTEIETGNVFEDSCWDPYCERVEELESSDSRFITTLIDVNGTQTSNNNNGKENVSSLGSSMSAIKFDDDDDDAMFINFRDDMMIDAQFAAKCRRLALLRKTQSCPNTPFRLPNNT